MKHSQTRLALHFGCRFFLLFSGIVILFAVFSGYHILNNQKQIMKKIARGTLRHVEQMENAPAEADSFASLVEIFLFYDDSGDMNVAIFRMPDRSLVWQTEHFSVPPKDKYFDSGDDSALFLASIQSQSTGIDDLLSTWHLVYAYQKDGFCIQVSIPRNIEVVERLLQACVVAILLSMIFSALAGAYYTRYFLKPFIAIGNTLEHVENGNLSARVSLLNVSDDIQNLGNVLNRALGELERNFNQAKDFSAGAAHELRTPLAGLRGTMEVCLSRQRSVEEYQETIGRCLGNVVNMSTIVEKLLLLSRPGCLAENECQELDFSSLVRERVAEFEEIAAIAQVTVACSALAPAPVVGDASLLGQVVVNLLGNAINFTPAGGTVDVSVDINKDQVELVISDSGPGISAVEREHVFEPFFQCDPSRHQGFGLGLAIVRWIVDAHRGSVTVSSGEVLPGATFRVSFPFSHQDQIRA